MKEKSKVYQKTLFLSFMMLFVFSCGLREENLSYDNPLIGTWYLDSIKCYYPDYDTGNRLERYNSSIYLEVEMVFSARSFTYAVTETQPLNNLNTCITSASGSYNLAYESAQRGTVSYNNLMTSEGCTVELTDSVIGSVDIPFGFSPLSYNVENLLFEIDENENLILQNSADFFGSDSSGSCAENCKCYGFFEKKNT